MILGAVLGIAAGLVYSLYQTTVYQSSTKILMLPSQTTSSSDVFNLNDTQLAQTFSELLITQPVLKATSEQLGYPVSADKITVQQVNQARLIEVTVEDSDPQRAADIANTIVRVFLEQNKQLQASKYSASEDSLQAQLQEVSKQIESLQQQSSQTSQQSLDAQITDVTKTISDLQAETRTLQEEIITLQNTGAAVQGYDDRGRYTLVTPTPSQQQQIDISVKQNRLTELKGMLDLYQGIYVNLQLSKSGIASGSGGNTSQVQSALVLYQQIYSNLLNNYEEIRLSRLRGSDNVVQVEEAVAATTPIRPNRFINSTLGGILGLFLAFGIAFTFEHLDDTLRSSDDVIDHLKLPVLGYIGKFDQRAPADGKDPLPYVVEYPRSPVSEAFRTLRTNIEFAGSEKPIKSLLITSPGVSEGKTTVAVNLSIVFAQAGKRVVLLDADLRRPHAHHVLGINNRVGLSDVLQNTASLKSVALNWKKGALSVITSGSLPANPAELLDSPRMGELLADLRQQSDITIIDGPPFILADASVLASRVDAVLVVVRPTQTHTNAAMQMLEQLKRAGARIIGVTINGMHQKDSNYYYRNLKDYASFSYDDMVEGKGIERKTDETSSMPLSGVKRRS